MKDALKQIAWCLSLGFEVAGTFLISIYAGVKLDAYFQTKPVFVLIGIALAFITVIKSLLGVIQWMKKM